MKYLILKKALEDLRKGKLLSGKDGILIPLVKKTNRGSIGSFS